MGGRGRKTQSSEVTNKQSNRPVQRGFQIKFLFSQFYLKPANHTNHSEFLLKLCSNSIYPCPTLVK